MSIGQKIKKLRELKDFTQKYMAEQLGVSQNHYSRMERNETQISIERLQEIARILDVQPEAILTFDDRVVFENNDITNSNNGIVYQGLRESERKLYEERIKHLEEEITFLRGLVNKA